MKKSVRKRIFFYIRTYTRTNPYKWEHWLTVVFSDLVEFLLAVLPVSAVLNSHLRIGKNFCDRTYGYTSSFSIIFFSVDTFRKFKWLFFLLILVKFLEPLLKTEFAFFSRFEADAPMILYFVVIFRKFMKIYLLQ